MLVALTLVILGLPDNYCSDVIGFRVWVLNESAEWEYVAPIVDTNMIDLPPGRCYYFDTVGTGWNFCKDPDCRSEILCITSE